MLKYKIMFPIIFIATQVFCQAKSGKKKGLLSLLRINHCQTFQLTSQSSCISSVIHQSRFSNVLNQEHILSKTTPQKRLCGPTWSAIRFRQSRSRRKQLKDSLGESRLWWQEHRKRLTSPVNHVTLMWALGSWCSVERRSHVHTLPCKNSSEDKTLSEASHWGRHEGDAANREEDEH